MITKKQQQIGVFIDKIINWPQAESLQSRFELSFYTKSSGALIMSKIVEGKYIKKQRCMMLNTILRISYCLESEMVILRVSHKMGLGGLMMLGEFNVSLIGLRNKNKKQMRFCLNPVQNEYLIIKQQSSFINCNDNNTRNNKLVNEHQLLNQLRKYEETYGLQVRRGSKTKEFIREREQFLKRHSNSKSRMGLSRGGRRRNDDFGQGDDIVGSHNNIYVYENNMISGQSSQRLYNNNNRNKETVYEQYYHNNNNTHRYSQNNIFSRQQRVKLSPKSSNILYLNTNNKNNKVNNHTTKRDNSLSNSEKTNSSSQKYLLLVNNLNVIPCDEYYETATRNNNKNNALNIEHTGGQWNNFSNKKGTTSVDQLQINTSQKYRNIYTVKCQQYHDEQREGGKEMSNVDNLDKEESNQKDNMVVKLQEQFKRHSEYY